MQINGGDGLTVKRLKEILATCQDDDGVQIRCIEGFDWAGKAIRDPEGVLIIYSIAVIPTAQ